jgi:hypothetical protein
MFVCVGICIRMDETSWHHIAVPVVNYKSALLNGTNIRLFSLSALFISAAIMGFGIVIVYGELLNTKD